METPLGTEAAYSLRATRHCILTGKAPFDEENPRTVLERVGRGQFPPPRAVRVGISRELEVISLVAMALRLD